jgi:lysophospholipase L1-like esterase
MARRSAAAAVLFAGSLLVAFGILELLLRAIYPPPNRFLFPQEFYDFDPETEHSLRPGQAAFTHNHPVRINSLGLRDGELEQEPRPGVLRVLALGDSQTFGAGLALADTWPKQLERMLQATSSFRWEVLNAGIPGTDTWQHEILLRRLLKATNPHAVVLAFYVNDVVPSHTPQKLRAEALSNTTTKRLVYLLKRSAVVTWTYYRLFLPWHTRSADWASATEEAVLTGGKNPRAELGWKQVEQSLRRMKELCGAQGVLLLLAILPRRDQVSGAHQGRAYQERVRALARVHGIEAIDLLPELSTEYRGKGDALFIPWDGHNSAAANRVIAVQLTQRLEGLSSSLGRR